MAEVSKQFQYAWVLKPGFKFAALAPYCEEIKFGTDGYADSVEEQWRQLRVNLQEFDPAFDVLIPIGSAALCAMAATILVRRCWMLEVGAGKWNSYAMGVYKDQDYVFWRVPTDLREEAYDILTK